MKNPTIVAIIPARIGSKGLPKKNVRLLAGKPLIVHTILAAKTSPLISRVIVSTDDEEIASIARQYKAEVPFIRPKELAQDNSPTLPVLKHAVKWLEENQGYKTDIIVCLFPTYPLRGQKEIDAVISKLLETNAGSACTVCEVEHHPYWMSEMEGDKTFFFKDKKTAIPERQNLPKLYTLGGGVIAIRKNDLMKQEIVFYAEDNRGVIIPPEKCIDIHTEKDMIIAEALMKRKSKIVIIGAGGHGKVVSDIIRSESKHTLLGFIDENPDLKEVEGIPVLGRIEDLNKFPEVESVVIAIGDNKKRFEIFEKLKERFIFPNIIHPNSVIAEGVKLGQGNVIAAGAIIAPGTTIGNNVIINHSTSIDHDNLIEDYVNISPGCHTSGEVKIKKTAFLGTGAIVTPRIEIGENSIIGAGTIVIKDLPANVTAVGSPARIIKKNKFIGEEKKMETEPIICQLCGANKNIVKHLEDHNKPDEITWLCESCHNNLHKNEKNKK